MRNIFFLTPRAISCCTTITVFPLISIVVEKPSPCFTKASPEQAARKTCKEAPTTATHNFLSINQKEKHINCKFIYYTYDYPYRTITQATTTCQAAITLNGEQHEQALYNCNKEKEVHG